MACCGGGVRPQKIRKQQIITPQTVEKQSGPTQRKLSRAKSTAASVQRQYVVPREQCTKCGYPGMAVHIAGRERMQCSNVNCRTLIN